MIKQNEGGSGWGGGAGALIPWYKSMLFLTLNDDSNFSSVLKLVRNKPRGNQNFYSIICENVT